MLFKNGTFCATLFADFVTELKRPVAAVVVPDAMFDTAFMVPVAAFDTAFMVPVAAFDMALTVLVVASDTALATAPTAPEESGDDISILP
jgi:hypothetical protein